MEYVLEDRAFSPPASRGQERPQSLVGHYLTNVAVGSLWVLFTSVNIRLVLQAPEFNLQAWVYFALLLRNSSLTILFLIRRPAKASSCQVKEWFVAVLGTVAPLFFTQGNAYPAIPSYFHCVVYLVMAMAGTLSLFAVLSLGRSFGIVPANRGIKTKGLYALVRHPIYACYLFFDMSFVVINFSWHNLSILAVSCLALYLRALYEERFLQRDASYRRYTQETRYMFFPGIV
jgi:protein-S-isoprenylcysteine O-methyltransferase Ste14